MTGASDLAGWERPHFVTGPERPFVFLAAFGADPNSQPLSRSRFMCSGIPDGLDVQGFSTADHPGYLEELRSGFLWDEFRVRDPRGAAAPAGCRNCAVLSGDVADPQTLSYLRDVIGIGEWLFACGAQAIFDPQAFTWWTHAQWTGELFAAGQAQPHKHVQILVSESGARLWLHTRGMRLFGRPDLSVRNVPQADEALATTLINRLIAFQALGGVIANRQEFTMAGLPAGIICHQQGDLEDPDFNNVHAEMVWPA